MVDLKKVLKGLECCKWSDAGLYEGYAVESALCEICPYHDDHKQMGECSDELRCDALELIRDQERQIDYLDGVASSFARGGFGL